MLKCVRYRIVLDTENLSFIKVRVFVELYDTYRVSILNIRYAKPDSIRIVSELNMEVILIK